MLTGCFALAETVGGFETRPVTLGAVPARKDFT